ncbi:MAG: LysR family transcriptional regulator [Acidobacteriota bacterium]
MSRLLELETFVRIIDAGSITAAADQLDVAKSAVSRRLRDLEQRLGVQLLNRTTRRQSLTDTGRSFYQRATRILEDLREAELLVSQEHCELAGPLRIAAPLSFGHRHLAPAVEDFARRHPEIEFDLDLNDRQVSLLEEGFDLAIRIAHLEDSSFIARRVARTEHVVCASPAYLEAEGTPEHPEDLVDHRCLVYSNASSPGSWAFVGPDGDDGTVEVPQTLRASSGDFLADLACLGRGIAMEPDFIVHEAIESGQLVPLFTDWSWPKLNVYTLYPPTRFVSRRVHEFIEFLSRRFEGRPYWQDFRDAL